ncbi:MoaD/ThiS family protein [Acidobacteria bacterium AH-259-D05]|nr:MoaD/ThiS family protein [Acidobacteria bacterium AH-259-D05]
MAAKIYIPTPLRPYAGNQEALQLEGTTIAEILENLTVQYAGLRKHLFTEEGQLRNFVNVYVNDEDIRYLQRETTPIKDSDTISIVPSIAGGSTRSFVLLFFRSFVLSVGQGFKSSPPMST